MMMSLFLKYISLKVNQLLSQLWFKYDLTLLVQIQLAAHNSGQAKRNMNILSIRHREKKGQKKKKSWNEKDLVLLLLKTTTKNPYLF